MRVLFAILVAALLAAASVSGLRASGEADVVFVSSGSAEVGGETTVTLGVAQITDPPNGAWTIDITYDRAIVSAVACEALSGSVCSPAFADDAFRSTGAIAAGIEAPMDFAHLTFVCERPGESPLALSLSVWGDATGFTQEKVEIDEGTITCTEPLDLITISSLDLEVGQEGTVVVEAERVAQPGPEFWIVILTYDATAISLAQCSIPDTDRACDTKVDAPGFVGFVGSATNLEPGSTLVELTFACNAPTETVVSVDVVIWKKPGETPGPREVEVASRGGAINCRAPQPAQLPSTGVADAQPGSLPATMPLAILGAVLLAAAFAFRRYALR